MLFVEHDAVLVVIDIRAVLQKEITAAKSQRYDAVILARRMIKPAGVALVLCTKKAFRVSGCLCPARSSYSLGILLRLGKIDRYIDRAVFSIDIALSVLYLPDAAYVIVSSVNLLAPVG